MEDGGMDGRKYSRSPLYTVLYLCYLSMLHPEEWFLYCIVGFLYKYILLFTVSKEEGTKERHIGVGHAGGFMPQQ